MTLNRAGAARHFLCQYRGEKDPERCVARPAEQRVSVRRGLMGGGIAWLRPVKA